MESADTSEKLFFAVRKLSNGGFSKLCKTPDGGSEVLSWDATSDAWLPGGPSVGTLLEAPVAFEDELEDAGVAPAVELVKTA